MASPPPRPSTRALSPLHSASSVSTGVAKTSAPGLLGYQPPILLTPDKNDCHSSETNTIVYTDIEDEGRGETLVPLFSPVLKSLGNIDGATSKSTRGRASSYTTSQETFVYVPLKDSNSEARLITLYPSAGESNAIIMCDIVTVEIATMQELDFEALSYVWGTNAASQEICVNGRIKIIRNNLWLALSQLRRTKRPRKLWVDDICIDQESVDERNHQVREMGKVYGSACTVLVWLGPSGGFSDLAFAFLRTLVVDAEVEASDKVSRKTRINGNTGPFYDAWVSRGGMAIFWSAFKELCLRKYWERLWVIQEVGLARKTEVHCGSDHISGDIFYGVIQRAKYSWLQLKRDMDFGPLQKRRPGPKKRGRNGMSDREAGLLERVLFDIQNSLPNVLFKMSKALTGKGALREFIIGASYSVCCDPRDKVFGLFGLALDPFSAVDYSVNLFDLFQQTMLTSSVLTYKSSIDLLLARGLQHSFARSLADKTPDQVRAMRDLFVLPNIDSGKRMFPLSGKHVGYIETLQDAWVEGQVGITAPDSPTWLTDIEAITAEETHERLQYQNSDVYTEVKSVLDLVQCSPGADSLGKTCPEDRQRCPGASRRTLERGESQLSRSGVTMIRRMVLQDSDRSILRMKVFRVDLLSGLITSSGQQSLVHSQGLAPERARLNDLICAIQMHSIGRDRKVSDTVHVVLRQLEGDYFVVGRAFMPSHCRELQTDEILSFSVSMLELQLITA